MSLPGAIRSLFVEVGLIDGATASLQNINAATDQTKANFGQVSKAAKDAGDSYRNVFLGVGAAAGVGGAFGLAYFKQGTDDLAKYQDAYATMRKNVGSDTDKLISDLKRASGGTITETNLILNANRAMIMDIPFENLPKMMQVSRAAARGLGEDVNKMFESIVTGSARESPLILDNLGIKMNQLAMYEKNWAASRGISVNAMDAEQKRLVFLQYVMENSDSIISKVDTSTESLNEQIQENTATWADLNREITSGALPAILTLVKGVNWVLGGLSALPGPVKGAIGIVGILATGMFLLGSTALLSAVGFGMLRKNMMDATGAAGFWAAAQAMLIPSTGGLTAALWAGATASWAFLAPWLPLIAAVGLFTGGLILVADIMNHGWEDSMLGKFIGWLDKTVPGIRQGFVWLTGAVKGLWEWITKIPEAITRAWSTVTDHPLFQAASLLFAATPMGMAINSARLVHAAAPVVIPSAERLIASSSSSRSIRTGDYYNTVKIEAIHSTLSADEQEKLIRTASKQGAVDGAKLVRDEYKRDFWGYTSG